ncbi:tRNA (N6-isopentenyl adenosine(37)-C2)-methylthiotransferase MiaB [Desulfuromonas acetoxidans]|uniref:tRNA (N6-isopentenyl adenosine(37)-C2)-methylthiotransferase MiaB n=1 Tax=Desulfuromonas acetoxidans TaxID=891 RepID=UPI00293068F2|nr:tRNA (N6-isopentenyl adenosine(37)-C2)-methylthiotransferase MiaB [Desulfuromonas acetoxidans]
MSKSFYLETFGCQMNVVDSEWIVNLLGQIDYHPVETPQQADLILLNTCSVRDKAERKVYGHLSHFKPLKDQRPDLILAVGGCVAQQEGQQLLKKVPYLDIVFGTHNVHKLPELIFAVEQGRGRQCETTHYEGAKRLDQFPQRADENAICRFVTVMQGCDNFCSYCVVPYVRGREVSRASGDILDEVRSLVDQGVREVTLLGQNVNSYSQKGSGDMSFPELLQRVHDIDGLQRLRFTSSHPKDLSDDLIACFTSLDKLCKHMHLALQSGSNRVLELMNRGYSREQYLERVTRLKQACPEIRMTTDLIVGFPGEQQADFEQTLDMLEQVRFADAFSFLYSRRPQTKALEMEDPVPADEKQRWFERMLKLQETISAEIWQQDCGTVQPVLVEGVSRHGQGQVFGRNQWNRIVNFDGPESLIGQQVAVRIEDSLRNSHRGVLAESLSF